MILGSVQVPADKLADEILHNYYKINVIDVQISQLLLMLTTFLLL